MRTGSSRVIRNLDIKLVLISGGEVLEKLLADLVNVDVCSIQ